MTIGVGEDSGEAVANSTGELVGKAAEPAAGSQETAAPAPARATSRAVSGPNRLRAIQMLTPRTVPAVDGRKVFGGLGLASPSEQTDAHGKIRRP